MLLDTSSHNENLLTLFDKKRTERFSLTGRNCELLQAIDEFLTKQDMSKDDIQGVAAVVGAGSFTSTRIAATVANVFGYARGIPLLAITKEQVSDPLALIRRILKQPSRQYISATYSAEPNIRLPGRA